MIVSTLSQALANVDRFGRELEDSPELQGRLSYARAWYAHQADDEWRFGPSKFIGYDGMTAAEYVNDEPRDGRQTENKLGQWFTEVPEDEPLFEELSKALTAFLGTYGKAPSAKIRISVANKFYEEYRAQGDTSLDRILGDLMIAVAKRLPQIERERVRAAL
jgi:hypothetical protein